MNKLEEYIKKFCTKHEKDPKDAMDYVSVRDYAEYLENDGQDNKDYYAGCGCLDAEDKSC